MGEFGWAFLVSLAVTLASGPLVLPVLRRLKFGQWVRDDGPARHLTKAGTPTMGGVMFLAGIAASTLLFLRSSPEGLVMLAATLGFGAIGFADDFLKVVLRRPLGLRAREKLLAQSLLAALVGAVAVSHLGRGTDFVVPFSGYAVPGGWHIDWGWWIYLVAEVVVITGTANAVNLTDGLDGLAAGVTVPAALGLGAIAAVGGRPDLAVFLAALAGGCLGFLWYNHHPARVFMGDTGALALGGALGTAAVIGRSELFLLIMGGIYVVEALSVILQVLSFQLTGRRILKMSPLHHHFELCGWSEVRVVRAFWMAGAVLAAVGLAGLYRLG
ncbi:MAG: phospho-N-acetylmuramoyl-pentapeptide-transferase [Firmicutes bacterium]|nr:phospho-N-acetylmuramoyl-pentapeptide-transferase [Bacillota bacterium]